MPDILLFGATGYTGRLTARALADRGLSFAIAGRDPAKLEALAARVDPEDVRVARAGDRDDLVRALRDVSVMITCVGPFVRVGSTAVEAALEAGVHYIDSTGEAAFVRTLVSEHDERARAAGIAMAPALGFDEVVADYAATAATRGLERPDLVLTYAMPRHGSRGTVKSALGIVATRGRWIQDGRATMVRTAARTRWAPMPPPLGPRLGSAFPFAEGDLAPLHLDLHSLELYGTSGTPQRLALRAALPGLRLATKVGPLRRGLDALVERLPEGPADARRAGDRWTILAEASSGRKWRNVALQGADPYGFTAASLAAGAALLLEGDGTLRGVVAPMQVFGLEGAEKLLGGVGVDIQTYQPRPGTSADRGREDDGSTP